VLRRSQLSDNSFGSSFDVITVREILHASAVDGLYLGRWSRVVIERSFGVGANYQNHLSV